MSLRALRLAMGMATLALASSALAQPAPDVATARDVAGEQVLAPLPLRAAVPTPPWAEAPAPDDAASEYVAPRASSRAGRVVLEVLGSALLGIGGAASGALVGGEAGRFVDNGPTCALGCLIGASIGGGIGALAGVTVGAWGAGRMIDGDGAWGWALVGGLAGEAGGFAIVLATGAVPVGFVFGGLIPVAGAVLGYEITSHESRRAFARARRPSPALRGLAPFLVPAPDGRGPLAGVAAAF